MTLEMLLPKSMHFYMFVLLQKFIAVMKQAYIAPATQSMLDVSLNVRI